MTTPAVSQRLTQEVRSPFGSLPEDLLAQSCRRVGAISMLFAVGWTVSLVLHFVGAWSGSPVASPAWPQPGITVAAIGIVTSVIMVVLANRFDDRPDVLLDLGLVFELVMAAMIGFLNQWVPSPPGNGISWICAIVLAYPTIVPSTPRKILIAAFAAATMDPLWYMVAVLRDVAPDASLLQAVQSFWPNYLCAAAAAIPARIIRGLGQQVSRAQELGSYKLGPKLGSGGMGDVYQAEHRLLARRAAIKLIRPDLLAALSTQQASTHVERFRREAEAAALLRSPHTIELYDFGFSADGGFYYVMELLDGLSLEELVQRFGPMPAERAVHLMLQACESIGEAHAQQLLHRDLKPANLFACRVGLTVDFVKVLDFGLVKGIASGDPTLTAPNVAAGTPAFMAPEVALGEPDVDVRVDVYSLGCVLYWLLTGQLVFDARSAGKVMHMHVAEPPAPPSTRTELEIPPELDAVVLACLAKSPDDRPANADEMRARLAALGLAGEWTRERAQRWWEAHQPGGLQTTERCDEGHVVPALSAE